MKLRAKIAILIIATVISFIGFNLIALSSGVDLLNAGTNVGHEITYDSTAIYIL